MTKVYVAKWDNDTTVIDISYGGLLEKMKDDSPPSDITVTIEQSDLTDLTTEQFGYFISQMPDEIKEAEILDYVVEWSHALRMRLQTTS